MTGVGNAVKTSAMLAGLGYHYHGLWWRLKVRRYDPLGPWARRYQAIFIHVPKTAGTSLYESFGMGRPSETHVPLSGFAAADRGFCERAFKFAVVRNPWDRLVSAYHYLKHNPIGSDDRDWAERHLGGLSDFDAFLAALQDPLFRAFVMTWRHFLPQWYFLCDRRGRPGIDATLRFEDLEPGARAVAERLGSPFTPARINTSLRRDYRDYFVSRSRDLVGRMYRKDADLFGYHF